MKITPLDIPDVLLIEPRVFRDERGLFYESFNEAAFESESGISAHFVQDNVSHSHKNVLRGLHYQIRQAQGKLVQVMSGRIFDVAVDLRRTSKTFGRWVGRRLGAQEKQALWIPRGFAHGFLALSDEVIVTYKVTDYWAPQFERKLLWNDPDLEIDWPLEAAPILSAPDRAAACFRDAELFK